MRRRLAEAGVPQPRFAAVRALSERRRALDEVGVPAVLKPANAGGQRGLFRVDSIDDVDAHLHESLAASPTEEAILEEYVPGKEVLAVVAGNKVVTLSDRLTEPFGVASAHIYPAAMYGMQQDETERLALRAVSALALSGTALVELIAAEDGRIVVIGCSPELPPVIADLIQYAQPAAVRFLALPPGRVTRVGSLDTVLAFPGVVRADVLVQPGDTIYPVRTGADRHGYVMAVADTNIEALERAEAAARLVDVEVA
jgi:formate-dependent phosphoribosylglycinamide formyltransferase (GAR transformylase)